MPLFFKLSFDLQKVKKGTIGQRCKACGFQGFIALTHRVTQFIIRNPPEMDPKAIGESKTKRKGRKEGKTAHHNEEETTENLNDTVVGKTSTLISVASVIACC